jgi:uncharacterized membrane protein YtjA (UPF0391 family)
VLLVLAIFFGVMSAIAGAYGFTSIATVTGRIARVLFLVLLAAFIVVILLQV